MQAFMTSLHNLIQTWTPFVWIVVAISLFGCGIGCMVPSEKWREKSRNALPWIVIGCGIAILSTVIGKDVTGTFIF